MKITAAVVHERGGAFAVEEVDLCDPRADELLVEVVASGMCATDMHGRDAYYPTKYPKVFGHEGAGIVRAVGCGVTQIQARRPRGDVLSVVRRMPELPSAQAKLLPARLRPEDERHPRRRLDTASRKTASRSTAPSSSNPRSALTHRQRALRGEGAQRRAARTAWPARLRRPDRRRRGAQCDEAASRATASPCSASARSDYRA